MTSFKASLTQLHNEHIDLSKITFDQIKESFYGLNHNPEEKIDLKYYEILKHCLNVCTTNKNEAEDIFKLFLSVRFSDGSTLLHKLIEREDLSIKANLKLIKLLITKGNKDQLNAQDQCGWTLLHLAALRGNEDLVKLMIKDTNVNSTNCFLWTPLHYAASSGHYDVVELLIKNHAKVDAKDKYERTPLHCAALSGNFKVLNLLIKEKAAASGEIILDPTDYYELLKTGLKICIKDATNIYNTDLAKKKKEEAHDNLRSLLEVKFSDGSTMLHNLMKEDFKKNLETIKLLINISSPEQLDAEEQTLLRLAAKNRELELVKLLIQKKAASKKEANLEYYAVLRDCLKDCLNVLNDKNNDSSADKKKAQIDDIFKLSLSVKFKYKECYNNIEYINTFLHLLIAENLATNSELRELTNLLINISSLEQINAKDQFGMTPLHWAIYNGFDSIVELLIASHAEVNAKDKNGMTPLHWAIYNGFDSIVELLIASHAEVNDKDKEGKTPLDYAKSLNVTVYPKKQDIIDLLEKELSKHQAKNTKSTKDTPENTLLNTTQSLDTEKHITSTIILAKNNRSEHQAKSTKSTKDTPENTLLNSLDTEKHITSTIILAKNNRSEHQAKSTKSTKDTPENTLLNSLDTEKHITSTIILAKNNRSEHQAKKACYITAMLTTITASITATTLFTTGKIASTQLNIIHAVGIIALSTLIISYLAYNVAFNYYSTPSPKLETSAIKENIAQMPSAGII